MSAYQVRGLTAALITRATQRACATGTTLNRVLRTYLQAYAAGHDTAAQQFAAQGGHARARGMTTDERSASARRAVRARWAKRGDHGEESATASS